jgi:1-acyl-sn-glycerol-3-phosphate acyltransferase
LSTSRPKGLRKRAWFLTRLYRSLLIGLAQFKVFNVTVHNRGAVPAKGPVILACNHISLTDPVFLWGAVRRNAIAVAMAELWKMPGVNWVVRSLGQIPVVRGDASSGQQAVTAAQQVLEHEGLLIIFPEGKCASGTSLLPFKSGVARIAFETGAPVVPAGIKGSNEVLPLKSRKLNRRAHVDVRFGQALHSKDFDSLEAFLAAIEREISALSDRPLAQRP